MIEKNIKELSVKFVGDLDWLQFKNFLILKMQEADTEKKFILLLESLIGSMFKNTKEMDTARKNLQMKPLSTQEKNKIDNFLKKQ